MSEQISEDSWTEHWQVFAPTEFAHELVYERIIEVPEDGDGGFADEVVDEYLERATAPAAELLVGVGTEGESGFSGLWRFLVVPQQAVRA